MSKILDKFKFWSDRDKSAKEILRPDLGMREWDELSPDERTRVWHHLKSFFEGKDEQQRIAFSIWGLNETNKYHAYGERFLKDRSFQNASHDFKDIFMYKGQKVLLELLDHYCRNILLERYDKKLQRLEGEEDETYAKRNTTWRYEDFDNFKYRLNDVFEHFGINVILTRAGFTFRQEEKIMTEIYKPVLNFLSDDMWKDINRELKDAFTAYNKKTSAGYSSCITHTISAIEAYLQLLINGKTGSGTLGTLINNAIKKDLIPNDIFSKQAFSNFKSILAKERKETGDAHPKKDYANAKNAQVILNLAMVFLQHCINYK